MVSQDKKSNGSTDKGVRERLLDSAEELFCEKGFKGTSVRDIAASAKCNIASVNYYFGGKEKLYHEVWRRHLIMMRDTRVESIDKVMSQNDGKPPLEELLKSFSEAFIGSLVDESRARRFCKLMAREMVDQHLPGNMFVDNIITPTLAAMHGALIKTCPGLDETKIPLVVLSIVGQLLHVLHIKAIVEQSDEAAIPKFDLAQSIDHVVKFSTSGIQIYVEGKNE
ncbi:MAG: CerR family C-terminal domain-containing protein [Planctomycetota bacterium]|jgi:AcrR family transcriptional regulator